MKQNIKLDKNTFGDSPAAITLTKILLEKYPGLIRKVSKNLASFNYDARQTWYFVKDYSLSINLLLLLRNQYLESIQKSNLPEEIKSYMSNLICKTHSLYRRIAESMEVNNKKFMRNMNDKTRKLKKSHMPSSD